MMLNIFGELTSCEHFPCCPTVVFLIAKHTIYTVMLHTFEYRIWRIFPTGLTWEKHFRCLLTKDAPTFCISPWCPSTWTPCWESQACKHYISATWALTLRWLGCLKFPHTICRWRESTHPQTADQSCAFFPNTDFHGISHPSQCGTIQGNGKLAAAD